MRIGVVQFPGTNCARETALAVGRAGMKAELFLWNEDPNRLRSLDGFVLAGGFSYEDRSRSGIIAAMDPVTAIIAQENARGKPVLGICNGAQILVETGLVPGVGQVAFTTNKRVRNGRILGTGFYNAWVTLRREATLPGGNAFTGDVHEGALMRVPAAHAEGRLIMDPHTLRIVRDRGLVAFRYCHGTGRIDAEFPVNPNGSVDNIAAVTNLAGTAMAIMPHPERTAAGDGIFRSLRRYLETHRRSEPPPELPRYRRAAGSEELLVELIITDNTAVSVENALNHRGVPVRIRRYVHWEIRLDETLSGDARRALMERIHASGELYNRNKETLHAEIPPGPAILVRDREDPVGEAARQALENWFGCDRITAIRHGVVWCIGEIPPEGGDTVSAELTRAVLDARILMNPIAQEGYWYDPHEDERTHLSG